MKFLVIALFLGCIAFVTCTKEEFEEKMKEYSTKCISETGIDEDVVKKAEEGVFKDDPKLKPYLVCYMKEPGFINDAGEYQIDVLKEKITEQYDEATAEEYIEKCTKKNHGNAEDNALDMVKCYHEHVIKHKH